MTKSASGLWLAIDTTTENLALALRLPDGSVHTFSEIVWRDQSTRLHPELANIFAAAKAQPLDLKGIIATCGPGSFTSIRIGLAAAKALAYAAGCPTVALTTTEALAAPWQGRVVHIWLEASSDHVHQQTFAADGAPLAPAKTMTTEQAMAQLRPGEVLLGNAVLTRRERLPEGIVVPDDMRFHYPQPQVLLELGLTRKSSPLTAVYVQPLAYRKVGA